MLMLGYITQRRIQERMAACVSSFVFLITALLVHDENAGGRNVRSLSWSPC